MNFLKINNNFKDQNKINFIVLGHTTTDRVELDKSIHYIKLKS